MAARAEAIRIAGVLVAAVGGTSTLAGGYEVLADRHPPRGWIRYQPPWAVPALIVGAILVTVGLALLVAGLIQQRRRP